MNRWMGLAAAVMLAACGDEAVTVEQADGVTIEDAGGDAPEIAAPDVRVDDTGVDPADVVQSETGVDAGPDAVVDEAGDVALEVVEPTGQCLGPFDGAARAEGAAELIHVAAFAAIGTCAREGLELDECPTELVAEDLDITPGCASCAAELASCAAVQCYETCGTDPAGPECGWCYRESGCEEAYAVCSGLEPWAWEPVCEGRWGGIQVARDCFQSSEPENRFQCIVESVSTLTDWSDECIMCAATYGTRLLSECPICIGEPDGSECEQCNADADALGFAQFCGGGQPATFEAEQ